MAIVRVALDLPLFTLFDYTVSQGEVIAVGQRVLVPFGRKQLVGVVIECAFDSELATARLKPVTKVLAEVPALSDELRTLLRFCSEYYHHPLGATILSALPTRLRSSQPVTLKEAAQYVLSDNGRTLDLTSLPKHKVVQQRILAALKHGKLSAAQVRALSPSAPTALQALMQKGWVEISAAAATLGAFSFKNIQDRKSVV